MHKASRSAKGAVLNASGMPRSSALSTFVRAPTEAVPLVFPRRRQLPLKACTNLANEIGGRRQLGFVELEAATAINCCARVMGVNLKPEGWLRRKNSRRLATLGQPHFERVLLQL